MARACPQVSMMYSRFREYFGLDPYKQFWFSTTESTIEAVQHHVEGVVSNMDDYLRHRRLLYPDHSRAINDMPPWFARQERGEAVVWITLEGFFWFPRTLMGFEKLMLAYLRPAGADPPDQQDLLDFNLRLLEADQRRSACPTFMTIAEDMSYNHGPMISRAMCDEFLSPYYRRLLDALEGYGNPDHRGHGRRCDPAGSVDGIGRNRRRSAAGAAVRRGRSEPPAGVSTVPLCRALRQDGHDPGRGGHARGI